MKLNDIDWENILGLLGILVFSMVLFIGMTALTADHSVQNYYLDAGTSNGVCLKASRNWASDTTVYCSDDVIKVLVVMKTANEQLTAAKKKE
jgi:hypothetical protein